MTLTVPAPTRRRPILQRLHILVVEDDADSRLMIARVLQQAGARVTAVRDAFEALEVFRAVRPDLLISDIAMPGMDGHSLIRRVRSSSPPLGALVPAISLSAFGGPEDRVTAIVAGFDEHLVKPVEFSSMISTITRVVNDKRASYERPTIPPAQTS